MTKNDEFEIEIEIKSRDTVYTKGWKLNRKPRNSESNNLIQAKIVKPYPETRGI